MSMDIVLAFWAVCLLFIVIPGADWAYVISAGINGKMVIPAIIGMLLGHFTVVVFVAVGIGALITGTPVVLTLLTIVGACYLFWLGISLVMTPTTPITAMDNEPMKKATWVLKGFGISGLNPKVFLLLLTLLPQFVDTNGSWSLSIQLLILGFMHIISCGVIYLLVGYGAKVALQTRPTMAKVVSKTSGVIMMVIAILLLMNQFKW